LKIEKWRTQFFEYAILFLYNTDNYDKGAKL